jgi:hypothetical protein
MDTQTVAPTRLRMRGTKMAVRKLNRAVYRKKTILVNFLPSAEARICDVKKPS